MARLFGLINPSTKITGIDYKMRDLIQHLREDKIFKGASEEEFAQRRGEVDKKIADRMAAIKIAREQSTIVDAVSGVTFDDFATSGMNPTELENHSFWTQVCDYHAKKFGIHILWPNEGQGICGVSGCENESDHYYDFDTAETKI